MFHKAVFFQSAYAAQEYAIIQSILPANQVGAGTGLYNGLSILLGGVGGSLVPGSIDAAILSIMIGTWLASMMMFVLSQMIRY
jgi:MFS transporter, ACS family, D-galactonate transporter